MSRQQGVRALTVREAALILNMNRSRVEHLCETGEILAEPFGRTWKIFDQRIEHFGRLDDSQGTIASEPDLIDALARIENLDLIFDSWVPDIIRHEDRLSERADLIETADGRLRNSMVGGATSIEIPKTSFFARTGHVLDLEDRIAFHAIVGTFAAKVESHLSGVVFSTRLAGPKSRQLTKPGVKQWKRWGKYVDAMVQAGNPWLIKSDLAAYFDCVRHETLYRELEAIGVEEETLKKLDGFLSTWSNMSGQGLPQGPDAARILGNFYMVAVDEVMVREGFKYSRYMDDIRIAGASKVEVVQGMRRFGTECRKRGLIASPSKTKLLHGKDAVGTDEDVTMASAATLMQARKHGEAKKRLKEILRGALKQSAEVNFRQAKFSLWRLAQLHDEELCQLVLDRLDDLAPMASIVGNYLSGFIDRDFVQAGLTDYLANDSNVRDPYLLAHLFGAMLEHPGNLPTGWIAHARAAAHDKNRPTYLRIVSANVVALSRTVSDVTWLRTAALEEADQELQRGLATALRRSGRLDSDTARALSSRSLALKRAVEFLMATDMLPSVVRSYGRVTVRGKL